MPFVWAYAYPPTSGMSPRTLLDAGTAWVGRSMSVVLGYARCSTDAQDLTAQRERLAAHGADPDRPGRCQQGAPRGQRDCVVSSRIPSSGR